MHRTYSELIAIPSYKGRFEYLKLNGKISDRTFGGSRALNQALYQSSEWRSFRNKIIVRDAYDMAFEGYELGARAVIHHLNPVTKKDILERSIALFDPENVVAVAFNTHEAIHYGDFSLLTPDNIIERFPNDTVPWKL